jgi:hypothetical protein
MVALEEADEPDHGHGKKRPRRANPKYPPAGRLKTQGYEKVGHDRVPVA